MVIAKEQWFNQIGYHQPKDTIDDIRSIDLDLDVLVAKFITPIERFRSYTSPNIEGILVQPGLSTTTTPMESRCHAFYRMLGLPAIASDGTLVNVGFPLGTQDDSQINIYNLMKNTPIKKAIADRESESQYRKGLFLNRNLDTVLLSLSMAVPGGYRKFAVDLGTLENATIQPQTIPIRTQYINRFFKTSDNAEIVNFFEEVTHQLAPFITDPVIAMNVEPRSGSNSVLVGLPFLDKKDLEFESGQYARRPGLEFILRIKLREQKLLDQLNISETLKKSINNWDSVLSTDGLLKIGISEDDIQKLKQIGFVDFDTIQSLFQTLKGLINVYYNATKTLEEVSKAIVWIPMPGAGGPESGSVVSTSFLQPSKYLDSWETERKISNLKIKSVLAKFQLDLGKNKDTSPLNYSDFAISEFQNTANDFEKDLENEEGQRSSYESRGSNALRIIELLGGEVSGLGLIDIVVIYLALWSLEPDVLLNFIDDAAAIRLSKIPELQTKATEDRSKTTGNAAEAYSKLVSVIGEILKFADYVFDRLQGSPKEGGTGSIGGQG